MPVKIILVFWFTTDLKKQIKVNNFNLKWTHECKQIIFSLTFCSTLWQFLQIQWFPHFSLNRLEKLRKWVKANVQIIALIFLFMSCHFRILWHTQRVYWISYINCSWTFLRSVMDRHLQVIRQYFLSSLVSLKTKPFYILEESWCSGTNFDGLK